MNEGKRELNNFGIMVSLIGKVENEIFMGVNVAFRRSIIKSAYQALILCSLRPIKGGSLTYIYYRKDEILCRRQSIYIGN